ncbi:MAG: DUF3179 domain-containing (seleno)protein [Bryobacteraceae bacterium]
MKTRFVRYLKVVVAFAGVAGASLALAQDTRSPKMPHTAVDHPEFVPASQAIFLSSSDVLIGVTSGGVAKAYPAADVGQHGVVHDQMPDGPIAVTWCGICNTGVVFKTETKGRILHFDSTGLKGLIGGNEVFKDRETGSRWQQATGTAISGPLKGTQLEIYSFLRTTWREWKRQHPRTLVLKPLPGYAERMPAVNKVIRETKFGTGPAPEGAFGHDNRLRPRETVAGLEIGGEAAAFPFSVLRKVRVVNEKVGETPVLIVHQPASDTTTAFEARVKDRTLRFWPVDNEASKLVDLEIGSTWNAYGLCLAGSLKGSQLKNLILITEFWFAWSEFHPKTDIYSLGDMN